METVAVAQTDLDRWLSFGAYSGQHKYALCGWQARILGVPWPPQRGWMGGLVGSRISRESYNKLNANIPVRAAQRKAQRAGTFVASNKQLLRELHKPLNQPILQQLTRQIAADHGPKDPINSYAPALQSTAPKPPIPDGPIDLDTWKFTRDLEAERRADEDAKAKQYRPEDDKSLDKFLIQG